MKALIRSKLVHVFIMLMLLAGAIAALLSSSILPTYASFSLDPTYGTGGKVITSFGNYSDADDVMPCRKLCKGEVVKEHRQSR